ncbi:tRNA pseudouridine(55) synthase TruB [Putridiphycobacter roseus]|uniref:tRNA pseudouridine synthase B n=1 Tax=Putridiphycobacter roseus TaxID=2219161 RepID=A0A2W1N5H5_9FLAO|nr:tRNA pseudouridine(55) synthase TruB [Putridiphycobacter roseus]PZE18840.1 tRNA pseudouridine(55) synthase TruB [Putridiphycobacter roseus]
MSDQKKFDFKAGELLLVDKPLTWTSFQVVNKLRWKIRNKINVKKIKVGHAGTLDPLATGLLILCTGKKTKEIESFMGMEKTYSGSITLGATRPSYDLETEIDATFPTEHLTSEKIIAMANRFVGEQDQMPPIFSAKKINGEKAYDLARKGEEVILKPKRITISKFEITKIENNTVYFIITCSKGTYIRSIAYDFGKALETGGYLSSLRREKIGEFDVKNAMDIDAWLTHIEQCEVEENIN